MIIFQYNPDSLTRTLQPQMGAEGGDRTEALRLKGAPVETIKLDIEIDATDQLERDDRTAREMGIYPQLVGARDARLPEERSGSSRTRCCSRSGRSRSCRRSRR